MNEHEPNPANKYAELMMIDLIVQYEQKVNIGKVVDTRKEGEKE